MSITAAAKEGWARASHSRDGSRRPRTRHGENIPSLLRLGWLQCRLSGVATVGESSGGVSLVDSNQRYPTLAIRIRIQTVRRAADSQKLYRRRGSCNLDRGNRRQGDYRSMIRELMGAARVASREGLRANNSSRSEVRKRHKAISCMRSRNCFS